MNYKYLALGIIGITFLFETFIKYLALKSSDREIPENVQDIYDEESYQKWLAYYREKTGLSFLRHIIMYAVTFIMIGFDLYARIVNLLPIKGIYLEGNAVLVIDTLVGMLFSIPFDYANAMRIEQKYGFNRMTKKTFAVDQIKDFFVGIIISCGLLSLFIRIHQVMGNWLLLVFTAVMVVLVLVVVVISPVIMRLYNKFEPLPDGELKERLCKLLEENGCSVRAIQVTDGSKRSSKANAYFTGLGRTKTIVLYDTLLEQMSEDEIVAVFAHEMGHNKHKDTLKMYGMNLFNVVLFVLFAWLLVSERKLYGFFGFSGLNYGFAFILLSTFVSFLSPLSGLFSGILQRKAEYAADGFAAENGYGKELISGLKRLARNSFDCLSPHPLVVKLTYSHPTISQRIAAIGKYMEKRGKENVQSN